MRRGRRLTLAGEYRRGMQTVDPHNEHAPDSETVGETPVVREAAADPNELTPEHPFYVQLRALRGWAQAETERAASGGERKLDRASLRAALDSAGIDAELWGIQLEGTTDAELIGQIELADESIWFAPAIERALEDVKAGRVFTLKIPETFGPED